MLNVKFFRSVDANALIAFFFSYIECGKVKQDQLKDVSKKKKNYHLKE